MRISISQVGSYPTIDNPAWANPLIKHMRRLERGPYAVIEPIPGNNKAPKLMESGRYRVGLQWLKNKWPQVYIGYLTDKILTGEKIIYLRLTRKHQTATVVNITKPVYEDINIAGK